jgi:hypothetical protein
VSPSLVAANQADMFSHHLLSLSLNGNLHLAPLKNDIKVRLALQCSPLLTSP